MNKKYLVAILIINLIIFIDQITKYIASIFLTHNIIKPITNFLNLSLVYNAGMAFGNFAYANGWQHWILLFITAIIIFLLILWLRKQQSIMQIIALSMIIGGAIANYLDKLLLRYVRDFIDFHILDWHFATFNIADTAISIGVFLFLITIFKKE